jgi:hypothetical protein
MLYKLLLKKQTSKNYKLYKYYSILRITYLVNTNDDIIIFLINIKIALYFILYS